MIIRLAGETEDEYQRRRGNGLLTTELWHRRVQKALEEQKGLQTHFRVAKLREACGVEPDGSRFTRDVYHDGTV